MVLQPFFKKYVKDKSSPEIINKTAEKAASNASRTIYYVVSSYWGYKVMIDNTDWLPIWMGGHQTGALKNLLHVAPWKSWP